MDGAGTGLTFLARGGQRNTEAFCPGPAERSGFDSEGPDG